MTEAAMSEHLSVAPAPNTIPHLLATIAARSPNDDALGAPGATSMTYRQLYSRVQSLVSTLNGLGLGRNDCVAIVLTNGPDIVVAFLAVVSCATCAPLNPGYREAEFEFYLTDLRAKALVVAAGQEDSLAAKVARKHGARVISLKSVEGGIAGFPYAVAYVHAIKAHGASAEAD